MNQSKLHSNYTAEEVEKLISSIKNINPLGKRNYLIVLLAARLGIRASDICRLKFDHIK